MDNTIIKQFIHKALSRELSSTGSLEELKRDFAIEHKIPFLRNPDIKEVYLQMLKKKKIKPSLQLEQLLVNKKIRTLSGVAVVAVLTKSYPCPGHCIYCPDEKSMPKSYLSNEPAVMRAIATKFDPYRQVQARLRALELNGHAIDKLELIVMGGTFSYLPKVYQKKFIYECFRAANDYPRYNKRKIINPKELENLLKKEQTRNEKSRCRIVGLTLETRPDYINEKEIINFRNLGCTRVELGIQSIYDDVLRKNQRGHGVKEIAQATKLLKQYGFKINYHMMPGLGGSTPKKDFEMFEKLFSNQAFQPDMLKIYPCVVNEHSPLYKLWKKKKYKALTNKAAEKLLSKIKSIIPPYVRITRLIRDIPEESIIAGPNITNLRQILQHKGATCQCIRCREVRSNYTDIDNIVLDRIDYHASGGKEIFLQYVSPDKSKLYALLRLRIQNQNKLAFNALKDAAIIREVHTYGKLVKIKDKDSSSPQHIGLGKKLILEAERLAKKEFGAKKIAVISGVGVRNYYRKLDYKLKDTFMVKSI